MSYVQGAGVILILAGLTCLSFSFLLLKEILGYLF